ncbi:ArsR/SmtB family transcription factor [Actinopolymorpha alba]|uniref:ArsR/SmtB family transcription factor n=1 Tax=Actinopolymorpha alba TaxID=533267 RepID=UPI00058ED85E|nr:DUF5937 family protein [Actinopolymorpha alba]
MMLDLGPEDLSRIRFAISPVWETVTSVRALTSSPNGLHASWLRQVRSRLEGIDLPLLSALVPSDGYIPDFLTPAPARRSSSFESGLAAIASTPIPTVASDLESLRGSHRNPVLDDLLADPAAGLDRIVVELERYWRAAIEPHWSRIRALLQADLAYRMNELASGGVDQLFRTLHPLVSFSRGTLSIVKYACEDKAPLAGRGLLLVPCVFAWPSILVLTAAPHVPTVTYSPRGMGLIWESPATTHGTPLAELVGRTRSAIVAQLDLPMSTTQLACQLDLSPPTLSVHLRILAAAGVVASQRDGRSVLYQRTELGDHLLRGAPETRAAS